MQSFQNVEQVPLGKLKEHPENARRGNVDMVADSLALHGQYKPVVVNKRKPLAGTIVAGHHLVAAAKRLGWESVAVAWVDLSEEDHRRVMLMDNRSSDVAKNDDQGLLDLLTSLGDNLLGTGYDESDVDALLLSLTKDEDHDSGTHLNPGVVSSYTIVFDDEGQLNDWNAFLRWLRKMDDDRGASIADRILAFLDERGWGDGGERPEPVTEAQL